MAARASPKGNTMHCLRHAACLALAAHAALGLPATAQGRIPDMQQAGALRYSCGGIGENESTLMRAAMKDYPLSLLFAQKEGAYLANVAVEVSSAKDISRFTANGPVCLIQLPAGSYKITATTSEGRSQTQSAEIGKGPHQLDFRY
jgi:hypothetical protein